MQILRHIAVAALGIFLLLGLPGGYYGYRSGTLSALLGGDAADAVSGASLVIPDQPSGEFCVLVNRTLHPDTLEQWRAFFTEQPVGMIIEDISCLTVRGDSAGAALADRYRARLAENQMSVRSEAGTLVVSRAECAEYDVLIVSREMAELLGFDEAFSCPDAELIEVLSR